MNVPGFVARLPVVLAGLVLAGLVLAGCGSPAGGAGPAPAPAPTEATLPARPTDLPLTGVRACDLLTADQTRQLGVGEGMSMPGTDQNCLWDNALDTPNKTWRVRLDLSHGASYYVGPGNPALRVVWLSGLPAVQGAVSADDPKTHCIDVVDVAPGQNLYVVYANVTGDDPGISHELACRQADRAAGLMIANLRRLTDH